MAQRQPETEGPGSRARESLTEHSMWTQIDLLAESAPRRIPDLDVASMRLIMSLRTASDVIFYDIHSTMRKEGAISAQVLQVLLFLQIYGSMELTDLTRMTGMSRASASALIATMSEQSLLVREPSATDRRKLILTMSPAGERAFTDSYRVFNRREAFWAEGLNGAEQEQLIALVNKLIAHRVGGDDYRSRR